MKTVTSEVSKPDYLIIISSDFLQYIFPDEFHYKLRICFLFTLLRWESQSSFVKHEI